MRKLLALIPIVSLMVGCGTAADPTSWFGEKKVVTPMGELLDITNPLNTNTLWQTTVGVGGDGQRLGLKPAVYQGQVFAADSEGVVTALDATTGSKLWQTELELPVSGGPGAGEDLVVVGTENGRVIALEQSSGKERWSARVTSEILSTPAIGQGRVVIHTIDGRLFGLDSKTGEQQWRYDRDTAILTLRGSSSPVINGDRIICGFSGGKLVSLSIADGLVDWDATVKVPSGRSELERLADIDGDPLVHGGAVYVATYQGSVAAVGLVSGRLVWKQDFSSYGGVAANWRNIYLSNDKGHVMALDPDNGVTVWQQQQLFGRALSTPAVLNDYLAVGDKEGYVHLLHTDDGKIVGRFRVGSEPIVAQPIEQNGVLYVFGSGGEIAAVSLTEQEQ